MDRLHSEKACLQKEKSELQRTVTELGGSIDKMHRDKVALESQMEMEEEGIVNRLNRCISPSHCLYSHADYFIISIMQRSSCLRHQLTVSSTTTCHERHL